MISFGHHIRRTVEKAGGFGTITAKCGRTFCWKEKGVGGSCSTFHDIVGSPDQNRVDCFFRATWCSSRELLMTGGRAKSSISM